MKSLKTCLAGLCGAALALRAGDVQAAAPQCYTWSGGGYCQYNGKVAQAYINAYQEIFLYFDTPVDPAQAASVGLTGVTVNHIARCHMTSNPDFGKALFAALLAAQARGATISVQMHSVSGGYLMMDRIWVME
jgi:hypothetical protein